MSTRRQIPNDLQHCEHCLLPWKERWFPDGVERAHDCYSGVLDSGFQYVPLNGFDDYPERSVSTSPSPSPSPTLQTPPRRRPTLRPSKIKSTSSIPQAIMSPAGPVTYYPDNPQSNSGIPAHFPNTQLQNTPRAPYGTHFPSSSSQSSVSYCADTTMEEQGGSFGPDNYFPQAYSDQSAASTSQGPRAWRRSQASPLQYNASADGSLQTLHPEYISFYRDATSQDAFPLQGQYNVEGFTSYSPSPEVYQYGTRTSTTSGTPEASVSRLPSFPPA